MKLPLPITFRSMENPPRRWIRHQELHVRARKDLRQPGQFGEQSGSERLRAGSVRLIGKHNNAWVTEEIRA